MQARILKKHSRAMRKEPTPAEQRLWVLLRNRRFAGFKFRRQESIGRFIADFVCYESRVIVELDGETHVGKETKDQRRHAWLESQGFQVIRVWNTELYANQDGLMQAIWNACAERKGIHAGQEIDGPDAAVPLTPRSLRSRRPSPAGGEGNSRAACGQ